jgi:adenylate kinase
MEYVNQFHPETELLVLDGIPRSLKQAKLLEDTLDVVAVIYLRADLSKMVERLRRRALKENRFDDASDEVIRRRLEVYERETKPVLEFYPKDTIHQIDATMSQIRVLHEILKVLVPLKEGHDGLDEDLEPIRPAAAGASAGMSPKPAADNGSVPAKATA